MTINDTELPNEWITTKLGSLVNFEYGKSLTESNRNSSGNVPVYGSNGIVGKHTSALTDKPAIIVGRKGAAGKVHIAKVPCWPIDTTYYVYPPEGLYLSYLYHILSFINLNTLDKSTAIPGLNRDDAYSQLIPLPPLPEQHRIVDKIEELFTRLDVGVEAMEKIQLQLKRYRQSVLKAAFEGKLTKDWREAHKDELEPASVLLEKIKEVRKKDGQYKELPPLDTKDLPELPEGWMWTRLGQLVRSVKDGPHYSPKYTTEGVPFITGGNVRPWGVDFENVKYISNELHQELSKRCKPEKGDILYTKGGTTGIARVNTYDTDFNVWVHVAVLKLCNNLEPFYVQHALNAPLCYSQSQQFTHGVGNQDLGLTRMVNIILALAPVREQSVVIEEIERRLSVIDKIEEIIENSLQQADRLRQSILKRAFEGKLVPQNPSDEPAENLLERIKAEKEKLQPAKKTRRKSSGK
ncbi:MAG: restriction endonuclease subunit S [Dehalococcoidales bacterium]|nr:restriction endonuclease subunit S [Dehalococcoidales bacterium]